MKIKYTAYIYVYTLIRLLPTMNKLLLMMMSQGSLQILKLKIKLKLPLPYGNHNCINSYINDTHI